MTLGGYLTAFGLTLIIELAVALAFDRRSGRLLLAVLMANCFTHPIFGTLLLLAPGLRGVPSIPIIEVVIVLVEAALLILALPGRKRGALLVLSLCMNAASYLAGVLLYHSWG